MGQLSAKLKQARLDRGLSLEELNNKTKIQKHYLEGIEAGDFSALPGPFYVRAFIKRYAEAVGLDGEALLAQHPEELPEEPRQPQPAPLTRRSGAKSRGSSRTSEMMPKVLVALFIVFILLVIWYFYLLSTGGNDTLPADEGGGVEYEAPASPEPEGQPEQPAEAPEEEVVEEEPVEEPPAFELQLESVAGETTTYRFTGPAERVLGFSASGDSWVSVTASGTELLSAARVFNAGETESIEVEGENEVFMRIGDYAALSITLNGEEVAYEQERKPQNIVIRFDDAE